MMTHSPCRGLRLRRAWTGPPVLVLLALACHGWAQESGLRAASGGVVGRLVVLPNKGSGLYSWALPVTLGGLLKQAQVEATSAEVLAALLRTRKPGDLGSELPLEWEPDALQAAADAGQVGKEQGYVLVASWNTAERSQEKWNDDTPFWLVAKLQRREQVLFDTTRLPREEGKYYRLADYDAAVRDLADMVVQNINPGALERAKRGEPWKQHVTLAQVRLLAGAAQDIAAGRLEEARTKLSEAQASPTGIEGSLVALQLLVEVNAALSRQSPGRAGDIGRQEEEAGRALEAQGAKTQAWAGLSIAEGLRLQGKWQEAAEAYVSWVQFLADQNLMQPDEFFPSVARQELDSRKPRIWDYLTTPALEAEWWATVGLSLYRGVSDPLVAQSICTHAEERAGADRDPRARAAALAVLAEQASLRSDLDHALGWHQEALAIRERLAPGSLDCALSYNSMGGVYYARGDLEAAMAWYQKALTIRERLAPNTLVCAESLNNVGTVYVVKGDFDRGLELYHRAMLIYERLSPTSSDCAMMYNNLGVVYCSKGDYASAAQWYEKARTIRERLVAGSLDCGIVYNNLGAVRFYQDDLDRALEWHQKAMAIYERLAPGSLACASSYNNLGGVYYEKGDLDRALEWHQRALAIKERLAPGSLACALSYCNLGAVYCTKGDVDRAVELCKKAVAIYERLAPGSLGCATSYNGLGEVYSDMGTFDRALELLQEALAIYERVEPGSLDCAMVYRNEGDTYGRKGDFASAVAWHKKALAVYERLSPDGLACARSASEIGFCFLALNKAQEAAPYLSRAAKMAPDDERVRVTMVWEDIAMGRLGEAAPIIEGVCAKGRKALVGIVDRQDEQFAKQLLDQGNAAGYCLLGRVWQVAGETEKATGAYDTFLRNASADHPWRADAGAQMKKLRGGQ